MLLYTVYPSWNGYSHAYTDPIASVGAVLLPMCLVPSIIISQCQLLPFIRGKSLVQPYPDVIDGLSTGQALDTDDLRGQQRCQMKQQM
jgi:hypothetical protein